MIGVNQAYLETPFGDLDTFADFVYPLTSETGGFHVASSIEDLIQQLKFDSHFLPLDPEYSALLPNPIFLMNGSFQEASESRSNSFLNGDSKRNIKKLNAVLVPRYSEAGKRLLTLKRKISTMLYRGTINFEVLNSKEIASIRDHKPPYEMKCIALSPRKAKRLEKRLGLAKDVLLAA